MNHRAAKEPMNVRVHPKTIDWHRVAIGDELPQLSIEITASHIVAGAIATRDFMPVHHDREYANAQGAPDIFMNILSDTGYCSRYLTDWAGPDAMITNLAIRLGVPVFPGTDLTYDGTVTGLERQGDEGRIDIAFRALTGIGEHVNGTASLRVPLRDAAAGPG
jgi:acyl dehydratase